MSIMWKLQSSGIHRKTERYFTEQDSEALVVLEPRGRVKVWGGGCIHIYVHILTLMPAVFSWVSEFVIVEITQHKKS